MSMLQKILLESWRLTGDMAPYLLLGFGVAGLLWVFLSPAFVERHLGGRGLWPVLKGALLGVPMPLCSCGVLPVSASLRQHGASKGATLSFLIATPQTGAESIFAVQALMGPVFAVFIVLTTFLTGLIGGAALDAVTPPDAAGDDAHRAARAAEPASAPRRTWRAGLRYGFVALPRNIGRAMLLGLLLSGVLTALIPENYLAGKLGPNFVSMLIMLAIGIPLYVCSSGSIPLAYAFMKMGVSPGAALVFLITGPATNTTALATITKILGRRAFVVYLLTIALCSLAAGLLLDLVGAAPRAAAAMHAHGAAQSWMHHACAVLLVGILLPSLRQKPKE